MKRIKANLGPKARSDFRSGKPPPAARAPVHAGPAHGSASTSWLGAGLFRVLIFGAIVVGGVSVVLWLRDMGSASGVNWLH